MINLRSSTTLQKILSDRLRGHRRTSWYETAKTPDKVRIDSASSKDSAAWLLALPRTPYLTVEASTFRTMICHRLAADIPGIIQARCRYNTKTPARMDRPQGSPPDGAVSTRQSKIHHPHLSNALVLNYAQMFREAGFLTRIEPQNEFTHIDGSAKRPDLHYRSTISVEAKHVSTSRSPIQRCCTRAPTPSQRQARLQTCNREQQK